MFKHVLDLTCVGKEKELNNSILSKGFRIIAIIALSSSSKNVRNMIQNGFKMTIFLTKITKID